MKYHGRFKRRRIQLLQDALGEAVARGDNEISPSRRAATARQGLVRATSGAFKALYALAVVIAAGGTYLLVADTSPGRASQPPLFWLLLANFVLIAGIAWLLALRVLRMVQENRETGGGARLRLRIIFLFSLAAAIPTLIVAGFLAVAINRSVESWFSQPVYKLVENASAAARASVDEEVDDVRSKAAVMASDLSSEDYLREFRGNRDMFQQVFDTQVQIREFAWASILDSTGKTIIAASANTGAAVPSPSPKAWADARENFIAISVGQKETAALFRLEGYEDGFLYVGRPIPPVVSERLTQAQRDLTEFREAEQRRTDLAVLLTLSYVEAGLLMLLGTAWIGMTAAERIAAPIGELAAAARGVRDGDFSVRMKRPAARDEIDDLADAFNQMTERIARQTHALDRARIDAETRSAFIEAALAGVEAGVIRLDPASRVTIANDSAARLLGFSLPLSEDVRLEAIAPEFVHPVRRALETGQPVDASFRRTRDGRTAHLQVRIAPEREGAGAVITFHDTTRLVLGQRQAAWRDVARRIAHEIRNPLTPIQLSAERLRRRFSGQITSDLETFERCTDTITRQVADIGRMVEEFSGFARMPKPTFREFDLQEMVAGVAFAQRMATPAISVMFNQSPEAVRVTGDERLLAQAMTNVVKNAAEAVERSLEGGEIKAGLVSIDIVRDADGVHICVRDNGPGFPAEDRERVLEPYVTTRKNGVGLGLAIVLRIIEDHGGRIILGDNERQQRGARVDIHMPLLPSLSEEFGAYSTEGAHQ